MPNTYTQLNIHAVFAVRFRDQLITHSWRTRLHQYLAGILNKEADKLLAVGGWKDHVHIFFELKPARCLSDVMRIVKANSSKWINEQKFTSGKFAWQEGYGAFSHSRSQRDGVIQYIMNQEIHHQQRTFREEYVEMLQKFEVDYEDQYLFEFFE